MKQTDTPSFTLDELKKALVGLGEIERSIDELYRVRLPESWSRRMGAILEAPLRVCVWGPGYIRVAWTKFWPAFLARERRSFVAPDAQVTFENTVLGTAKDICVEKGGNGIRLCLTENVITAASFDLHNKAFLRPHIISIDIWDAQRRILWQQGLQRIISK